MHELFGERFIGRRQPAWHGLGTIFPEDLRITLPEGVKQAGADYNVVKIPMRITLPDSEEVFEVPNKYIIAREPTQDDMTWKFFGTCGSGYGLLQNMGIAETLDPLAEQWPLETMGVLHDGKGFFVTLRMGGVKVGGEDVNQFLLFYDFKDGGTKAKFAITPVRVVCQNTLTSGLRAATVSADMTHTADVDKQLKFRADLLGRLQKAKTITVEAFNHLAKVALTAEQATSIWEAAHPYPNKGMKAMVLEDDLTPEDIAEYGELYTEAAKANDAWMYTCSRVDAFRAACGNLFEKLNDEYPKVANTAWAAWNAVVEVADYRTGLSNQSADYHSLFGGRAKEKARAFAHAMTLK